MANKRSLWLLVTVVVIMALPLCVRAMAEGAEPELLLRDSNTTDNSNDTMRQRTLEQQREALLRRLNQLKKEPTVRTNPFDDKLPELLNVSSKPHDGSLETSNNTPVVIDHETDDNDLTNAQMEAERAAEEHKKRLALEEKQRTPVETTEEVIVGLDREIKSLENLPTLTDVQLMRVRELESLVQKLVIKEESAQELQPKKPTPLEQSKPQKPKIKKQNWWKRWKNNRVAKAVLKNNIVKNDIALLDLPAGAKKSDNPGLTLVKNITSQLRAGESIQRVLAAEILARTIEDTDSETQQKYRSLIQDVYDVMMSKTSVAAKKVNKVMQQLEDDPVLQLIDQQQHATKPEIVTSIMRQLRAKKSADQITQAAESRFILEQGQNLVSRKTIFAGKMYKALVEEIASIMGKGKADPNYSKLKDQATREFFNLEQSKKAEVAKMAKDLEAAQKTAQQRVQEAEAAKLAEIVRQKAADEAARKAAQEAQEAKLANSAQAIRARLAAETEKKAKVAARLARGKYVRQLIADQERHLKVFMEQFSDIFKMNPDLKALVETEIRKAGDQILTNEMISSPASNDAEVIKTVQETYAALRAKITEMLTPAIKANADQIAEAKAKEAARLARRKVVDAIITEQQELAKKIRNAQLEVNPQLQNVIDNFMTAFDAEVAAQNYADSDLTIDAIREQVAARYQRLTSEIVAIITKAQLETAEQQRVTEIQTAVKTANIKFETLLTKYAAELDANLELQRKISRSIALFRDTAQQTGEVEDVEKSYKTLNAYITGELEQARVARTKRRMEIRAIRDQEQGKIRGILTENASQLAADPELEGLVNELIRSVDEKNNVRKYADSGETVSEIQKQIEDSYAQLLADIVAKIEKTQDDAAQKAKQAREALIKMYSDKLDAQGDNYIQYLDGKPSTIRSIKSQIDAFKSYAADPKLTPEQIDGEFLRIEIEIKRAFDQGATSEQSNKWNDARQRANLLLKEQKNQTVMVKQRKNSVVATVAPAPPARQKSVPAEPVTQPSMAQRVSNTAKTVRAKIQQGAANVANRVRGNNSPVAAKK